MEVECLQETSVPSARQHVVITPKAHNINIHDHEYLKSYTMIIIMSMCLCVCVCACERARVCEDQNKNTQ